MGLSVGVVCSVGIGAARGGREQNEDNFLICRSGTVTYRDGNAEVVGAAEGVGAFLAVCDGMGGHEQGEIASTAAVRVLAKLYQPKAPTDPQRALRRYVLDSHRTLHERARGRSPGQVNMGTTLTAAWILGNRLSWIQVGDSRLYLYRQGDLTQITSDHTRAEFARRDHQPRPTSDDDSHLAQNFIFGSRGLGDDASLRIEVGRDTGEFTIERGDVLVLCTDGLSGTVDDIDIADVLRNTRSPKVAASTCVDRAIARGSDDNITVMIVRVDNPESTSLNPETWTEDVDDESTFMV